MGDDVPVCRAGDHGDACRRLGKVSGQALGRAAQLFRAMGDVSRLSLLQLLADGELCVTDIVAALGEKFSTVSQRLRLLRSERLVQRRRQGTHLFYALADRHILDLVQNALAHVDEGEGGSPENETDATPGESMMSNLHAKHDHDHGPSCGHTAIKHEDHVDYLHDGHLHHVGESGVEEHTLGVTATNPAGCTPEHHCGQHDPAHHHGPGCGHEAVPHGDHVDYLVNGHLHHPHGDHCDDHGPVQTA